MKTLHTKALAFLLLTAAVSSTASAATVLSYSSLNNSYLDSGTRMIGWRFSVTEDIGVSAIGWFDWNGNGLARSHEVGIWNTTGASLLASVVIPNGTTAILDNGFRYTTLNTPLTLQTGATYIIAGLDIGASGDPHVWDANIGFGNPHVNGFASDPRITLTVGNAIGSVATSFAYPTGVIGDARRVLMGPNFTFTPVPIPAAVWLFGSAFAGLIGFSRRNSRR